MSRKSHIHRTWPNKNPMRISKQIKTDSTLATNLTKTKQSAPSSSKGGKRQIGKQMSLCLFVLFFLFYLLCFQKCGIVLSIHAYPTSWGVAFPMYLHIYFYS